jgi:hypothetical protein
MTECVIAPLRKPYQYRPWVQISLRFAYQFGRFIRGLLLRNAYTFLDSHHR